MGEHLESYLRELRRQLPRGGEEREESLLEIRDHLLETTARLTADGLEPDEADQRAVQRFGDAREIARQYPAAPARLRLRRAYLYAALFATTWVLAFGLSAAIAEPLRLILGDEQRSSFPMNPLLHATLITGVAAAGLALHWALRGWIARATRMAPPRALLLLAAGMFALRGVSTLWAAQHTAGPFTGASFAVASLLICWAFAGVFTTMFVRSRRAPAGGSA